MKKIPDGVMHLVEVDPPYGIKLQDAKRREGESIYSGESYNEVDADEYEVFLFEVLKECYRVMVDHSWLIIWFAPEPWFEFMYSWIEEAGFKVHRMCGIWVKPSGQNKRPETRLANQYEMFFYASKGKPAIAKARGNVFAFQPVPSQKKTHPTERPVELMKEIYETFSFPNSRVLIPFLGSGNGILAAQEANMNAVGFELSKDYRDSFLVKIHSR